MSGGGGGGGGVHSFAPRLCRRCEAAENEFKHFTFHFLLSLTSVTRRVSSLCYIN